ncbi:MAG: valine--tRNA ligase, partial [Cellvibrionales bacterium TMED148]
KNESFSIAIPPPNVTGTLHMGHALQYAIMDAIVRRQRMKGKNVLWQVGTDHAGIATQMVVERMLASQGSSDRLTLGREKFIQKIWGWKEHSGDMITRQMRRLGNSVDWRNERFTMDESFCKSVREVFVRLYREKLIYRGKRLVNWDPKLKTAISDLEVENREVIGKMWHIRYPLSHNHKTANGSDHIIVATTRPETMLGDTGVAVNPKDPRYSNLIGSSVIIPFVNRLVPIIADDHAQMDKGTGCVKITPAHDFNDYQVGQRHKLNIINIFTDTAQIRQFASCLTSDGSEDNEISSFIPEEYREKDRFEVREMLITDLSRAGLLESTEENLMIIPYGDRSGTIIEPMLTNQWYVRASKLSEPAIRAVKEKQIQFVPDQYQNMYFSWMNNLEDWCISRQLWWGHRIPAWYDESGKVYVGENELQVREEFDLHDTVLIQDSDVLDTWFSSGLWTFATLGWPDSSPRLKEFHPTSVLVTGFDIIFFWVARMIMLSMHLLKDNQNQPEIPFKTVYVHGLIRDEQGKKMSKSKGNVIDPLDMIDGISLDSLQEKRISGMMQPKLAKTIIARTAQQFPDGIMPHGADALRFTLCALASTGRDINWDMKRLEGYRNFCNKLWNAARYVLTNTKDQDCGENSVFELSVADRWIVSALQRTTALVNDAFENYRFDLAANALYEFIWNEYCDWYLELAKPVISAKHTSEKQKTGARKTLLQVLDAILRLSHPIIPFITEEIWRNVKPATRFKEQSIMLQAYPSVNKNLLDKNANDDIAWIKTFITCIRTVRAEMNISPGKMLLAIPVNGNSEDKQRIEKNRFIICRLANLEAINWASHDEELPRGLTTFANELEIVIPITDQININEELCRLEVEIAKITEGCKKLKEKLSNKTFRIKAPAHVVEKEEIKLADQLSIIKKLTKRQQAIKDLT